jgi:hypothetical protein
MRLLAQDVSIEGTVLDAGTNIPVAGAKVALVSGAPLEAVVTEASGTFHFSVKQPGDYFIEANAPGFLELPGKPLQIDEAEFEPGASVPVRSVTLKLSRSSGLTGHIQDADTREAMALVTVRVLRFGWRRGKRRLTEERIAFTDDDGMFHLESLTPGEYVLEIQNRTPDNEPGGGSKKAVSSDLLARKRS